MSTSRYAPQPTLHAPQGFGWAIAKNLAEAGAEISLGVWVPALNIFETSFRRGEPASASHLPARRGRSAAKRCSAVGTAVASTCAGAAQAVQASRRPAGLREQAPGTPLAVGQRRGRRALPACSMHVPDPRRAARHPTAPLRRRRSATVRQV